MHKISYMFVVGTFIFSALTFMMVLHQQDQARAELSTYPDWVAKTQQNCDFWGKNCSDPTPIDPQIQYQKWLKGCQMYYPYNGGKPYSRNSIDQSNTLDPQCVEQIIDDRLAPIHKQLDRIERDVGHYQP